MNLDKKIEQSKRIMRLAAEMSEHYYHKPIIICYSGGKDSDVILRLAMECLNKDQFEVLHSITTVDSPITNRYVNEIYAELKEKGIKCEKSIPVGRDGKPTNMWKLIVEKGIPPTRFARYCCEILKEVNTPNRIAVLGVRENESLKRKGRDVFIVIGKKYKDAKFFSLDHANEVHQEALEHENEPNGTVWDCSLIQSMRNNKEITVNPIYEWSDANVWEYLNSRGYKHNPMYEMGYSRVGCVGCPLANYKQKQKEFRDFPTYKKHYIESFDAMLVILRQRGWKLDNNERLPWTDGEAVFNWWIEEYKHNVKGQMSIDDFMEGENE